MASADDVAPRISKIVAGLISGDRPAKRKDIAVIVGATSNVEPLVEALLSSRVRAEPLSNRAVSGRPRDCVIVATAEDFKGLERPIIVAGNLGVSADPSFMRSAVYTAFSRANHTLFVVGTHDDGEIIDKLKRE